MSVQTGSCSLLRNTVCHSKSNASVDIEEITIHLSFTIYVFLVISFESDFQTDSSVGEYSSHDTSSSSASRQEHAVAHYSERKNNTSGPTQSN